MSTHHLQFSSIAPQDSYEGGYRIQATKDNFPPLQNMSIYKLVLHSKAAREPHWHANADELGYCLQGTVLVSLFGNKNTKETFIVRKGDAFFIPSGALHYVENIGKEEAQLLLQFSADTPQDFGLSSTLNMFSNAVLGNTWGVPSSYFDSLKRTNGKAFISTLNKSSTIEKDADYSSAYHYALELSASLLSNPGGSVKVARQNVWPILQQQALYSLTLTGDGMREPHWHPQTAELGYVESGKARMSILSPSGKIDTYEMAKGDIYFIPKAYPHHIENLNCSDLHLLIFFDQAMPQDVGFTASVKSFSDEVLSATIGMPSEDLEKLPRYYEDLFIVNRFNPLEIN